MKLIKPSHEILSNIDRSEILQLLEIAGRVCYKSEDKITEKSGSKFVKMLVSAGHEAMIEHFNITVKFICDRGCCYTKDTKVLTENGWKYFYEVGENELVYTKDDDEELKLIKPLKLIKKEYDGEIYNYKNTYLDLAVTPNHNMWVYDYNKRSDRTKIWKFIKAEEMNNKIYKFSKSCNNFNGVKYTYFTLDKCEIKRGFWKKILPEKNLKAEPFLKFLGIWITDGSLSFSKNGAGHKITISQTKKQGRIFIEDALLKLGLKFSCYKNEYRISDKQLFNFLVKNFIKNNDCKKTYYVSIPNWLKKLDKKQLEYLLEGIVVGDGSPHTNCYGWDIYTASKKFAEDLIEIALKIGKSASINLIERYDRKGKIKQKNPNYRISIINKDNLLYRKNENTFEKIQYNDFVYCLELPEYHRLYVMRNGKTAWCGNSHELVRHRLASYAQESTRYCNYSKDKFDKQLTFILPNWFREIKEGEYDTYSLFDDKFYEEVIWIKAMSNAEFFYKELILYGWTPQQARSVLPNSLKTEIVVTANLREWRHILKLRTSTKAHPQIREIMLPLLNELKGILPEIYGDIEC